MKSNFFGLYLGSRVLKGTFMSIFVNYLAVSFHWHVWFGVCSFCSHYMGITCIPLRNLKFLCHP